ncbi:MAG TPA: 1,2-phenylacetyl-CoA epoxidase subunit PaaC, partial [Candidatus Limnocylindrales bacterium]
MSPAAGGPGTADGPDEAGGPDAAGPGTAAGPDSVALTPALRDALAELLLALADDELVIGYWDSEWTGIAPLLEEDVAMTSLATDEIGHARAFYTLFGDLTGRDPDAVAYDRPSDAVRHAHLLDHPRTDWAFSIARRWLYDTADAVRLEVLAASAYRPLAELVAKVRREERYHLMHADAWLRRLARADAVARGHLDRAWALLVDDGSSVFAPLPGEAALVDAGILPDSMDVLAGRW